MMLKAPIVYVKQLGLLTMLYNKNISFFHTEYSRYHESTVINHIPPKSIKAPPPNIRQYVGLSDLTFRGPCRSNEIKKG